MGPERRGSLGSTDGGSEVDAEGEEGREGSDEEGGGRELPERVTRRARRRTL